MAVTQGSALMAFALRISQSRFKSCLVYQADERAKQSPWSSRLDVLWSARDLRRSGQAKERLDVRVRRLGGQRLLVSVSVSSVRSDDELQSLAVPEGRLRTFAVGPKRKCRLLKTVGQDGMVTRLPPFLHVHRFMVLKSGPRVVVFGAVHGNERCSSQDTAQVVDEQAARAFGIERGVLSIESVTTPYAYQQRTR